MRHLLVVLSIFFLTQDAFGQQKDSAYHLRINQRVTTMMDHIHEVFPNDAQLCDTLQYFNIIYARHLEAIQYRTDRAESRIPQYDYALNLRKERYKSVMSENQWSTYLKSLEVNTPNGFSFCEICRYALSPNRSCKNCGSSSR